MNVNIKNRCIMIFPQFVNINVINSIRDKYDPSANKVRPHITLVFPFESSMCREELEDYLNGSLREVKCFNLALEEIIKLESDSGFHLAFGVKEGKEKIKALHNKLYAGKLNKYKPYWLNKAEFIPHMTVGKFDSREDLENAYENVVLTKNIFSTLVDKISVEIIYENQDSIIETEINLRKLY